MNLYGFVENDGVNRWDRLGLECGLVFDAGSKSRQEKRQSFGNEKMLVVLVVKSEGLKTDVDEAKTQYLEVTYEVTVTHGAQSQKTTKSLTYFPKCEEKDGQKKCIVECDTDKTEILDFQTNDPLDPKVGLVGAAIKVSQSGCSTKKVNLKAVGIGLLATQGAQFINHDPKQGFFLSDRDGDLEEIPRKGTPRTATTPQLSSSVTASGKPPAESQ